MLRPDHAADVVEGESFFVLELEPSDELDAPEELELDDVSEDEDDDVDSFEAAADDELEELRLSVL